MAPVLCLILTCVYPASSGYAICWQVLPKLMDAHSKSASVLYSVYCVLFAAVAVLSFITGSKLWSVRPGADRFARRFFLIYLFANIGYFLFWIVVDRPTERLSFAAMGWYHVVGPIASTALWYSYLEHSKRVIETYRNG